MSLTSMLQPLGTPGLIRTLWFLSCSVLGFHLNPLLKEADADTQPELPPASQRAPPLSCPHPAQEVKLARIEGLVDSRKEYGSP